MLDSPQKLLLVFLLAPLALLGLYFLGLGPESSLTRESFDKIEVGMGFDDVVAIMEPPGRKLNGQKSLAGSTTQIGNRRLLNTGDVTWKESFWSITVHFENGKVVSKKQTGFD